MSIRRRYIQGNEDLTFIFNERKHGYKISIVDNHLETETCLDSISKTAEQYYIAQLIDLTKQKLQQKQSA